MREAFRDWVFRDMDRRNELVSKYNVLFNSTRPREYDGSHLVFPGMTPDIELKGYQKNAVAHVLYGNNTLLAHCVGAGKTFEMVAAAMESKRLGLCQKSLFVVPNHLTEQWAGDFLRLYPGANILAATKKDFQPANRKKFCSRIATGDYDAVIIGHSQFEKIPLSAERQTAIIERQIADITQSIEEIKAEQGERYTIKQMEKMRKTLQTRLDKLNASSRKDDVVTFEQLGVDRFFVDDCQKALVRRTLDAKRLYRRTGTSLQMHEQSVRTIQRMMGEMRGMGVYCKTGGQPTRQTLKQNEQRQQKVQSEVRKWRQK